MQPKHILFYTDTPLLGGAENQMYLLAKFLPKEKYTVELACSGYRALNSWCQQFMKIGVNVRRLRVIHKHDPRHFLYLKDLFPKFDLLHLHIWNPASCRYALAVSRKFPVVITEHDPFPLKGLKGWIKKKLMEHVQAIIVCSQAAKNIVCSSFDERGLGFAEQMGPKPSEKKEGGRVRAERGELVGETLVSPRIKIVPNGIDIEEFRAQAKSAQRQEVRRSMLGNELNRKIILCAAELHERKGQKYLLEAIKQLIPKFPDIQVVFAGEGVLRKYYEKLARPFGNRVAFLGRRRDIGSLMAASDIFVLPSIREAFGLVLLEAASVGLPTIATNAGGIPEIIEHGKTGMLAVPGNPKELATAIAQYLEKPAVAAEFAKRAKEKVEMEFHAKTMAMRTAEVYDGVLAEND